MRWLCDLFSALGVTAPLPYFLVGWLLHARVLSVTRRRNGGQIRITRAIRLAWHDAIASLEAHLVLSSTWRD